VRIPTARGKADRGSKSPRNLAGARYGAAETEVLDALLQGFIRL